MPGTHGRHAHPPAGHPHHARAGDLGRKEVTLILPTYHPSALLRDETGQKKREAWQDLKSLREKMREMDLYPKEEKTWTQ